MPNGSYRVNLTFTYEGWPAATVLGVDFVKQNQVFKIFSKTNFNLLKSLKDFENYTMCLSILNSYAFLGYWKLSDFTWISTKTVYSFPSFILYNSMEFTFEANEDFIRLEK
jgi:hypothetical protein